MYLPPTPLSCSTLLHLLIARPILIIFLSLSIAVGFIRPKADYSNIEYLIDQKADEIVKKNDISTSLESQLVTAYNKILKENRLKKDSDKHFGPARLTKEMIQYVSRFLDCESEYYQELMSKPKLNKLAGFVYFLELYNQLQDINRTQEAYNKNLILYLRE